MSSNDEDVAQIEIPGKDWVILAAIAWNGHQIKGPGVVILELDDKDNPEEDENNTKELPLYYLPADTNQIRQHIERNEQLAKWLEQYNPEDCLLLAIAHPIGVFYSCLTTPQGYPSPSAASPEPRNAFADEISDALNFEQSSITKEWPFVTGIARSHYLGPERDVIVIDVSAPSEADLTEAVERSLKDAGSVFLRRIQEQMPEMLSQERSIRVAFETRLAERWGKALDIFETILMLSQEAGSNFNRKYQEQAAKETDWVFAVLTRLHARACLTTSEILALLRTGHAAGAHARWRTLHELTITAYFIKQFGADVAERYLEHEYIETYKAATEYQRYCKKLGYERHTRDDMDALRSKYDRVVSKYGEAFKQDYGWADDALHKLDPSHMGKATFTRIEEAIGLEHWRPYYGMANYSVHASTKGITFNLGLINQGAALLAGPSNAGLTDPGHSTCISLAQITTTLLGLKSDFEGVLVMNALNQFVQEAGEAFIEAHRKLEEDEAKLKTTRQE